MKSMSLAPSTDSPRPVSMDMYIRQVPLPAAVDQFSGFRRGAMETVVSSWSDAMHSSYPSFKRVTNEDSSYPCPAFFFFWGGGYFNGDAKR